MKAEDLRKEFDEQSTIDYWRIGSSGHFNPDYTRWLEEKLFSQPQGENTMGSAVKWIEDNEYKFPTVFKSNHHWAKSLISYANSVGVTPMTDDDIEEWIHKNVYEPALDHRQPHEILEMFKQFYHYLLTQNPKTKEE